jgi:hypothetical protein
MRIQDWDGHFRRREWMRALGLAVAGGVILGVFGPFGSFFNGNAMLRVFSWTVNLVAGTLILGGIVPAVLRLCLRLKLGRTAGLLIGLLVATVPVALFSAVFGYWLWPQAVHEVRPEEWYTQALMVEAVMAGLWLLISLASQAPRATTYPEAPLPEAQLIDLREPVLCLQMEDHYVRIHRASGSRLELMPMHEAITRYGQAGGIQVHRSWWVSAAAIDGAEREVRNWRLRLSNGMMVPVARNRITEVRARGWIGDDA